MLVAKQLHFQYPKGPSFSYPDIELSAGEHLLILGNSGSGKSTLLQVLSGLRKAEAQELSWNGMAISSMDHRAITGTFTWIFQHMQFIPSLNVTENLELTSLYQKSELSRISDLANRLGIDHLLHQPIQACSRGEQQRISFLRSLLSPAPVILADEPSASLDKENCLILAELMKELCQHQQKALLIVTHDERIQSHFERSIRL